MYLFILITKFIYSFIYSFLHLFNHIIIHVFIYLLYLTLLIGREQSNGETPEEHQRLREAPHDTVVTQRQVRHPIRNLPPVRERGRRQLCLGRRQDDGRRGKGRPTFLSHVNWVPS